MYAGMGLRGAVIGLLAGLPIWAQGPATAAPKGSEGVIASDRLDDDSTHQLEEPPFPGVDFGRALRLQAQSRFLPSAHLGPGQVDLYAPEFRARLSLPINERAVARVGAQVGLSHYDFSGGTPFRGLADPLDLYQATLTVDGAYQLTKEGQSWLVEGESWSLLGGLSAQSAWEGSRFERGFGGGGALGIGYRLPDRLRVSLGALVNTDLENGGIDISPFGSLRWNITESLTLRDRSLGVLLEYRLSNRIELFTTAFRSTDTFRLKDRFGLDDLSFRDRRILTGAGLEWKITSAWRMNFEAGAVVKRKLRAHSGDQGTLFSESADPAPYFNLRFELRPGR